MEDTPMASLPERHLVHLLAALQVADDVIRTLTAHVPTEGGWYPEAVAAALRGYGWATQATGDGPDVWLAAESGSLAFGPSWDSECLPCLEPLPAGAEPNRYSGNLCDRPGELLVWGGRGMRQGVAVAYPCCEEHAARWGSGYRISDGELVSFEGTSA